ncbi:asparagine--tRNA ligase [bacterium]|nr:asparagine--tRNA ligase [bacterium]
MSDTLRRTKIKELFASFTEAKEVLVKGWVRTRRDSKGGFSFLEINDGSCFDNIQAVVPNTLPNYESEVLKLTTGSSVAVKGKAVAAEGRKQSVEIQAEEVKVYGFADPAEYPLFKQRMSVEYLRDIAHLRPRTNIIGAMERVRNCAAMAIHEFFQSRGFVWVHTPLITTADCEGAGQMFKVTTLDLNALPRTEEGQIDYKEDFFGKPSFLTVSGQLDAENYACALGDVYTFGPTFRAENSNTPRHLAEFWMVEPEMAFADLEDNMRIAEAFVKHIVKTVLEKCPDEIAFFDQRVQPGLKAQLEEILGQEFERCTYTRALEILSQADRKWEFPINWGDDLQTEHERYLTEEYFKKPVFVIDWPASLKPFYMKVNSDGKTVRAMDCLVPRFGEIIGGSQREEDLAVMDRRIDELGMKKEEYWWYRDLRRFGTVPHSGFGLGFERIILFVTGIANIRDVIPFPRTPKNANF